MSGDLIERLRAKAYSVNAIMYPQESALLFEAVDRLAALEAEASEGERRGLERAAALVERGHANLGDYFARQMASRIRALIPEAPAREVWQPIGTAPKDGSEIILFFPSYKEERVAAYRWRDVGGPHPEWEGIDGWSFDEGPDAEDAPTHWRPLPPPPSQDREPDSQRGAK